VDTGFPKKIMRKQVARARWVHPELIAL